MKNVLPFGKIGLLCYIPSLFGYNVIFLFYFYIFLQGEEYKLFWPDQPEFIRMAAKFGATIVPFGSIGEDDLTEVIIMQLYICYSKHELFICINAF